MWTRSELKQRAKDQMKGRYWNYLGASLMLQLASYVISIPMSIITQVMMGVSGASLILQNPEFYDAMNNLEMYSQLSPEFLIQYYYKMFLVLIIPTGILWMISIMTSLFLLQPVSVGVNRWYIRSREERNLSISMCFSVFKKGSYLKTVGAMAYSILFLFLWTCLFYIPGIIKSYAYRMIPYIIADNPSIGAKRALKLSCQMTKGHKFNMFILDLSFIGWYLVGFLCCCIGVYAVIPYQKATNAELYDLLKKEAVEKNLCTMEELGYIRIVRDTAIQQN